MRRVTYSNSLANSLTTLVLDTSVVINLHASTYGSRILEALPNSTLVPQTVAAELERESRKNCGERHFLEDLAAAGNARVVPMSEREYRVFEKLVSGCPSLGDGEAATISIATRKHHCPIIDERQGRLQARALLSGPPPAWSLDLFRHPHVISALGTNDSVHALYLALREGRMRIHEAHCDHVVSLIGVERALECKSLPGFKVRRKQWQIVAEQRIRYRSAV